MRSLDFDKPDVAQVDQTNPGNNGLVTAQMYRPTPANEDGVQSAGGGIETKVA